ncbi:hypothetical protein [Saccharomonospora viridis]|uniref:hypothetical protein n=1 Tax=Saccharomonospora viridis TaxID=1852 RepID=UPI00240979DE|nr:hypothetical protein [Saccharomonospora viridis]
MPVASGRVPANSRINGETADTAIAAHSTTVARTLRWSLLRHNNAATANAAACTGKVQYEPSMRCQASGFHSCNRNTCKSRSLRSGTCQRGSASGPRSAGTIGAANNNPNTPSWWVAPLNRTTAKRDTL